MSLEERIEILKNTKAYEFFPHSLMEEIAAVMTCEEVITFKKFLTNNMNLTTFEISHICIFC